MSTVRIRGGKRQPRYYYLKDRGAENLCRYMSEEKKPTEDTRSAIQKRIDEMVNSAVYVSAELKGLEEKLK